MIWLALLLFIAAIALHRSRPIPSSEIQGHDLIAVLRRDP